MLSINLASIIYFQLLKNKIIKVVNNIKFIKNKYLQNNINKYIK